MNDVPLEMTMNMIHLKHQSVSLGNLLTKTNPRRSERFIIIYFSMILSIKVNFLV